MQTVCASLICGRTVTKAALVSTLLPTVRLHANMSTRQSRVVCLCMCAYLISLWQDGDRGSTGVHSATGFSRWYSLHSVNATLILEATIHPLPADGGTGRLAPTLLLGGRYLNNLRQQTKRFRVLTASWQLHIAASSVRAR